MAKPKMIKIKKGVLWKARTCGEMKNGGKVRTIHLPKGFQAQIKAKARWQNEGAATARSA